MSKPSRPALKTAALLRVLAWFVALSGLSAALGLAHSNRIRSEAGHRATLDAESRLLLEAVQREAVLFEDTLRSVRHLHALSDAVQPEAFEEFASKGLGFHEAILGGYAFAQVLPHAVRESMESLSPGSFPLLEADPAGGFRPAAPRSSYVRLGYQRPEGFTGWPIGFDLGRLESFRRAWETGRTPEGFLLVQTTRTDPGGASLLLLAPIAARPDADASPGGFVIARLDPARLVARAMNETRAPDWTCRLIPPTAPETPGCGREDIVSLGGQSWRLQTKPPDLSPPRPDLRELGLPLALIPIGLLAAGLLRILATRTASVERMVDKRTGELREEMAERERLEIEAAEAGRRERERMGRELHDSIGQKLSAAAMLARAVSRKLDETRAPEAEDARLLAGLVKESAAQARQIAHGLAPVELPGGGLAEALRRLAGETRDATGLDCDFTCAPDVPEPESAAALHLYRIAQEAATNAARHARARTLRIQLAREPDGLRLEIEDDGIGLPDTVPTQGLGLRLMKRRAAAIGSRLELLRGTTGGVRVVCRYRPAAAPQPETLP